MYPYPSTSLSFVPKPSPLSQSYTVNIPAIHEASFNGNNIALPASMMRHSHDGQFQTTMKCWMPRNTSCNTSKSEKTNFKCSSQSKILLATALVLLNLTAIGLAVYAVVNSNNKAMYTTDTTYVSTTTSTTTTAASLPSQCTSANILNDATRLITAVGTTGSDYGSFSTTYTWYRFLANGVSVAMATSPPAYQRCYTYYSGWYAGIIPSYGQTIVGTACYVSNTNICAYSNTIMVANCGSYFVYGLIRPPTNTYIRYCTI